MQEEYPFTLPKGYHAKGGNVYRNGKMRLATARDELQALSDPKVKITPEYAPILLLAQVITLDGIEEITTEMVENFYASDVNFLQQMYETINSSEDAYIHVVCPHCKKAFDEPLNFTRKE